MTQFRERLWPSPWLFIATGLVIPASLLVFLPINPAAGVVVSLVLYAGCVALLLVASPRIEVTEDTLIAGKALLPLHVIGTAESFEGPEATAERGPRLNANAWLMIRGWIDPVVRIELVDDGDPTPYWLLSTRRPQALIDALEETRKRTRDK